MIGGEELARKAKKAKNDNDEFEREKKMWKKSNLILQFGFFACFFFLLLFFCVLFSFSTLSPLFQGYRYYMSSSENSVVKHITSIWAHNAIHSFIFRHSSKCWIDRNREYFLVNGQIFNIFIAYIEELIFN